MQETDARPAILAHDEVGGRRELSWAELRQETAAFAAMLRRRGIGRVAAFMPNRPETVVAFLACVSIGAVWPSRPCRRDPVSRTRRRRVRLR